MRLGGLARASDLSFGVANTITTIRSGAVQVDGCVRSFGAGAGNMPTEAPHAYRAAERYQVLAPQILVLAGQQRLVGGQEDQLIDIAVDLAAARGNR